MTMSTRRQFLRDEETDPALVMMQLDLGWAR